MEAKCLMDIVSVWGDEKVLEMDGGDGCTTVHLKRGFKMEGFM